MIRSVSPSGGWKWVTGACATLAVAFALILAVSSSGTAAAPAQQQALGVVKPVLSCDALARADLTAAVGRTVTVRSAEVVASTKGPYCRVQGTIAPTVGFEVQLPTDRWTQRYLQIGCGGSCGSIHLQVNRAGGCVPALNGEFVVAGTDMGHQSGPGQPGGVSEVAFGADPEKRIDFAYRANHETAVVAKALIRAYYGRTQRYAYFSGCSDGGREALAEAQRYPDDFDGIGAGAPVALISVHNSLFHGWEQTVNKRADGSYILYAERLPILHKAVVAHCPTLSGVDDGILQMPAACRFDPSWVSCPAGGTDTSACLTAEEIAVVQKLYDGPLDGQGTHFAISGMPLGSETQWPGVPSRAPGARMPSGDMVTGALKYLLLPEVASDETVGSFRFTREWFERVNAIGAPLYNAANTDLRRFYAHGGKLILWHGLADTSVPYGSTVAYYEGVQKEMGAATADRFVRLFLVPGMGHCFGGDGFPQIDVLSPLLAWTEMKQAPKVMVAGRTPPREFPGRAPGAMMGPPSSSPVGEANLPTLATRPLYPYPMVAQYTGTGDPKDAANYRPVKAPVPVPTRFDTLSTRLIGPNTTRFFHVENGKVVQDKS